MFDGETGAEIEIPNFEFGEGTAAYQSCSVIFNDRMMLFGGESVYCEGNPCNG